MPRIGADDSDFSKSLITKYSKYGTMSSIYIFFQPQPIFRVLQRLGEVDEADMYRIINRAWDGSRHCRMGMWMWTMAIRITGEKAEGSNLNFRMPPQLIYRRPD